MSECTKGFKYQLLDIYETQIPIKCGYHHTTQWVDLFPDGYLLIYKGYAWDGASGPGWILNDRKTLRGALVHDALYQLMREGLLPIKYKDEVDLLFWSHIREDGVGRIAASIAYRVVRRMGGWALNRHKKRITIGM